MCGYAASRNSTVVSQKNREVFPYFLFIEVLVSSCLKRISVCWELFAKRCLTLVIEGFKSRINFLKPILQFKRPIDI